MRWGLWFGVVVAIGCSSTSNYQTATSGHPRVTTSATGATTGGATGGTGGSNSTSSGGSTSTSGSVPDSGCEALLPLHQCPVGLVEVAGTAYNVCAADGPIRENLQVLDANDSSRTAVTDVCGNFYFCVDAGTTLTPLVQGDDFIPTTYETVIADKPGWFSLGLLCTEFLSSFVPTTPVVAGDSIVLMRIASDQQPLPTGNSGSCPTYPVAADEYGAGALAGWSPVLLVPDGGPLPLTAYYFNGAGIDLNATSTNASGLAFFLNVDPTLGTLQIAASFDGGGLCGNGENTRPYEVSTSFVVQQTTVSYTPFVGGGALLVAPAGCQSSSSTATLATVAGLPLPGSRQGVARQTGASFAAWSQIAIDGAGNVLIGDRLNNAVRRMDIHGNVMTLAGNGAIGFSDGTGGPQGTAELWGIAGLTVDGNGLIYLADSLNHAVREITAQGNLITLAGNGLPNLTNGAGGVGGVAQFDFPFDVAADGQGNLFVADSNNSAIRKLDSSNTVTTFAGGGSPGFLDGQGTQAQFNFPRSLALDDAGNLLVADSLNHAIRKIDPTGMVTTLAGNGVGGKADGNGTAASFELPVSVRLDDRGNAFVADTEVPNLRMIDPSGNVTTVPTFGVNLQGLTGVAPDHAGDLFVLAQSSLIERLADGGVQFFGTGFPGFVDGASAGADVALFGAPSGIAVDDAGTVYVADQSNHSVARIDPTLTAVETLVGAGIGAATAVAALGSGTILVVSPTGLFSVAATGAVTPLSTRSDLEWVASGALGVTYATTTSNLLVGFLADGGSFTRAGDGDAGFAQGDGGSVFNHPGGLAVDAAGNVYLADTGNNAVRKIDALGDVTTLAGSGAVGFVDGLGAAAQFNAPASLALDGVGNLYVTDPGNGAVRRIDPQGYVTTLAGNGGQATLDGPGGCTGTAELDHPKGIALDAQGNVFVSDDTLIRKITP